MTPEDLAALRAQDASAWRHRDILALADALEQAWADRDRAEDACRDIRGQAYLEGYHEGQQNADAALARVRALCDNADLYGYRQIDSELLRAAIEGTDQ